MTQYRLTPAAQRDLSDIWDYTAEHWGRTQAEVYIGEIRNAIDRIADDPRRGRTCEEVRVGYRRSSIGSHLLFFKEASGGIDIIRILHQRMDPGLHL